MLPIIWIVIIQVLLDIGSNPLELGISDINSKNDVDLIEIKTTKAKNIKKLPYGAFFGITENEKNLFKLMKNYKLCIVHTLTKDFVLLTFNEYEFYFIKII